MTIADEITSVDVNKVNVDLPKVVLTEQERQCASEKKLVRGLKTCKRIYESRLMN